MTYALAGRLDVERGWGLRGRDVPLPARPWPTLGADTWFNLGDRDLATHLIRTAGAARRASRCRR